MRCLNCNLIVPKGEKVCPICKAEISRKYRRCDSCFIKLDISERVCPKCGCDLTVNRDSDFVFYDDEHEPHCVKHRNLWFFTAVVVFAVALSFFLIQQKQ